MRSVSDTGATAPISALTYAFSLGSDRGFKADDSESRIIAGRAQRGPRVKQIDTSEGEARPGIDAGPKTRKPVRVTSTEPMLSIGVTTPGRRALTEARHGPNSRA